MLGFFQEKVINLYTKFMNHGHLFGPFVIYKMWLLFKRANKIHVLLFITYFYNPIIISFNHRTTHQPRHPNQCQFGPIWDLRSPLRTLLDFYNALHLKHFEKWMRKRGGDNFTFCGKNLITNWIFSMTAKHVKLPEIWSLFVW